MNLPIEVLEDHLSDRYRIEREIGRGGMGIVYLAEDLKHRRRVAIKILQSNLTEILGAERFLREIEVSARLQHPFILPLHDSGDAGGLLYYVMPYIEGEPLRLRIARERQLPIEDAVRIAAEVAQALGHAHGCGIVHRDIKPDNILLSDEHVYVADFGIARAIHEAGGGQLTRTGLALGTPAYMSPEQAAADDAVDGRSDLYSLGCVLYEMLAGQPPFTGTDARTILARHASDPVPPLRTVRGTVTPELEAIVGKALAKAPADRYSAAREMANALGRLGVTGVPTQPARHRVGKRMLAVLPFENLSSDPEQEYFSDGLTEEMIAQLGRVDPKRLGVIARTSVMGYKKSGKTVQEIGAEMKVDFLLEGSVRRSGNRIRVTAKLIQVNDQTQVWMSHYDGELSEIFEVQSDVAGRVAKSLTIELLPDHETGLGRPATRNPAAYELYLRACYLFGRGTDEARREALERFHEAIALDPEYALAHARLANCYLSLAADNVLSPTEAYGKAKQAACCALELDESLAVAHAHLALVAMAHDWSWSDAQVGFRRAVELDPNSAYAHGLYSTFLAAVGRTEDAVAEARRALELDPRSAGRSLTVGTRLIFARRYEEAIEQFRRTLELDPQYEVTHYYVGKALLELGRHDDAIAELERAYAASGSPTDLAELARAWAKAGDLERSRGALAQLLARGDDTYVSPTDVAKVYEALGEKDAAFERLERALEVKASDLVFLRVDPDWDGLRAEPRFEALLSRIGLPVG